MSTQSTQSTQTANGARPVPDLFAALADVAVHDLAQPMFRGMPQSPNHPPFQLALQRRHGDYVRADGSSAANEIIVTGGHVGTHVDAFAHVSHQGLLHGGIEAASVQSHEGFSELGIDTFPPSVATVPLTFWLSAVQPAPVTVPAGMQVATAGAGPDGPVVFTTVEAVLLDVTAVHGVDVLPAGAPVTGADLQAAADKAGVTVQPGDAVLIGTGWSRRWDDRAAFVGGEHGAPGPDESAAGWCVEHGVRLAGAETIAFEQIKPGAGHALLPVHRMFLVEHGISIVETMRLWPLLDAGATEFGLVLAPLKVVGATGAPVRPLALVPSGGTP